MFSKFMNDTRGMCSMFEVHTHDTELSQYFPSTHQGNTNTFRGYMLVVLNSASRYGRYAGRLTS